MKLISVTCPNCGSELNVSNDELKAKCQYCGSNFIICDEVKNFKDAIDEVIDNKQSEYIINQLLLMERYYDNGEYKDSLTKCNEVLGINPNNYEAIFYRGLCLMNLSNYLDFNLNSSISGFIDSLVIIRGLEIDRSTIINQYMRELVISIRNMKDYIINIYNSNAFFYDELKGYNERLQYIINSYEYLYTIIELNASNKKLLCKEIVSIINYYIKPKCGLVNDSYSNDGVSRMKYSLSFFTKISYIKKRSKYKKLSY